MIPAVDPVVAPVLGDAAVQARRDSRRKWRIFGIGLLVRLLGLALISLGDGSPSVFRKAVVILGVILSIGGIAVLRYLLISGFRKKKPNKAPEPTSGIVTPPAEPGVAPIPPVAHL